jgi:endonuclease YncB( thermonuclease family)
MPFTLIRGTFHVTGYSPDGDSIRFKALDKKLWTRLSGPPVERNAKDHAQLRFEGIDALETHYLGTHQPLKFALKAREVLLSALGITNVQWNPSKTRVVEAQDGVAGYILTRTVERNRRPVAFVYVGECCEQDGAAIQLGTTQLQESVNCKFLAKGLAYPTYYRGLFHDLRRTLTKAVHAARQAKRGLWPSDCTISGVLVEDLQSISQEQVILPKLFRRIAQYLEGGGSIAGFKAFLREKDEGIYLISSGHYTHFDTVIEVEGDKVRMTVAPEDILFE